MSLGIIDNYNFKEMEPMRYWAPPASWSLDKKKETTQSRIFSGDWYAAEKKDGYFAKLVKDEDGNIGLYSRSRNVNGEFPEKHEWVPHLQPFFDWLPNGTCLLGELYLPSKPGSSNITSLLGCLKEKCVARQAEGEKLRFYIFDVLAINGQSLLNWEMTRRIDALNKLFNTYADEVNPGDGPGLGYVEFGTYYSGRALWAQLQKILANGGEGMVIIRGGAKYQPGKRPSKDCQKVKKELAENIDCFFTGRGTPPTRLYSGKEIESWKYWQNMLTGEKIEGQFYKEYKNGAAFEPVTKPYFYGWAGSLEIGVLCADTDDTSNTLSCPEYPGYRILPIGSLSGLTDEIKANFKEQRLKCIEVAAMEIMTSTLALRHGKLMRFREDLSPLDCTLEKLKNSI